MPSMRGAVLRSTVRLDLDDPSASERGAVVADEQDAEQAARGRKYGPREEPGQVGRRAQPSLPGLRTRGRQPKKSRRPAGVIQANSAR
jgi:hypothetical protein